MAENKKSFILYADLKATLDKLPNEKAGELFKFILDYVNDLSPATDDLLLQIAFEPIKQQLKRDLKDWQDECTRRSEIGRLGGLKSAELRKSANKGQRKSTEVNPSQPIQADNDTVTDSDTDNINIWQTDMLFMKTDEIWWDNICLKFKDKLNREFITKHLEQYILSLQKANWKGTLQSCRAGFNKWLNTVSSNTDPVQIPKKPTTKASRKQMEDDYFTHGMAYCKKWHGEDFEPEPDWVTFAHKPR